MSNNNYPDSRGNNPTQGGEQSPWNIPNQPAGEGYFVPLTTRTGYEAKYPIPSDVPQASVPPVIPPMMPDEAYRQAEQRVNAKLRFYKHLTSYLLVNALLWTIAVINWASTGFGSISALIWPIWVTVFWGIGLASDYIQTFGLNTATRQRMIEEEMRRMRR
ncbi:MAG: 2TM domain-containing protein [Chloroflexi bacterium]|nr:2TM domain-containing protein [Chloroflexota bacterium]